MSRAKRKSDRGRPPGRQLVKLGAHTGRRDEYGYPVSRRRQKGKKVDSLERIRREGARLSLAREMPASPLTLGNMWASPWPGYGQ